MPIPKRFGLSTLLLMMLVVSSIFGFLAWRSNRLKSEVARINKEGVGHVTLSDDWLYPIVEQRAFLKLVKDIDGRLYVARKNESPDVVASKFEETKRQIKGLGANEVLILLGEQRRSQGQLVEVHVVIKTDNYKRAVENIAKRIPPAN